jgi:phosphatidylinositol-3-phosphatase
LFSGSTQGVTDDSCPERFLAPNLASALRRAGRSFAGFAEGLPATGSPVCTAGEYARKHVPWTDFGNVPAAVSRPFASFPGSDLARLPTVAFVVPNLCDDMHDCSVATGDDLRRTDGAARPVRPADHALHRARDDRGGITAIWRAGDSGSRDRSGSERPSSW